jgi:hypothetical protein
MNVEIHPNRLTKNAVIARVRAKRVSVPDGPTSITVETSCGLEVIRACSRVHHCQRLRVPIAGNFLLSSIIAVSFVLLVSV